MDPIASISVDMDSLWCYADIHGLPRPDPALPDPVWALGMRRLLDLFDACGVRATFFCVGRDLDRDEIADLVREAHAAGHEIANHSHDHPYNLRDRPYEALRRDLAQAEARIEAACGQRPVGFRTPGYNLDANIARLLVARGYDYDASLFPCPPYYLAKALVMGKLRLSGQPSRSQMTRPWTLLAPTRPYVADPDRPWRAARRGAPGLVEIPMALVPGVRFPLIGTSLHLLGAQGFKRLTPLLRRAHPQIFSLEFHGLDLIDALDPHVPAALTSRQPDLPIPTARKAQLYRQVFASLKGAGYRFAPLHEAARRWRAAQAR